jgi:hypothetical protein
MRRIHPQERRTELLGESDRIPGLETPRKRRLERAANALATPIGTNPLEVTRDPDRDQHDDHPRRNR